MAALRNLALLLAAALAAGPASGQMTASSPAEIAAAGLDCWTAVSAAPVNEAMLRQKGWEKARMTSAQGQPIVSDIGMFGKKGNGAVLMITPKVDPRGCMVMSRAATAQDVSASIPLLFANLKAVDPAVEVKKVSAQEVGFFALPKAALFKLTGDPAKPGVLIQVSYTAAEKK